MFVIHPEIAVNHFNFTLPLFLRCLHVTTRSGILGSHHYLAVNASRRSKQRRTQVSINFDDLPSDWLAGRKHLHSNMQAALFYASVQH